MDNPEGLIAKGKKLVMEGLQEKFAGLRYL